VLLLSLSLVVGSCFTRNATDFCVDLRIDIERRSGWLPTPRIR
jgi:hypothetical protein